ncbi:hypothetical protein [Pyrofollis japonicus]|uniref:hypothetical protein n=1 Tax=Pyrofollis japonicus TaxID=3060460 RepID=UPI00295B2956|nr:hypothetical protein [Pyrofollis japonicus]
MRYLSIVYLLAILVIIIVSSSYMYIGITESNDEASLTSPTEIVVCPELSMFTNALTTSSDGRVYAVNSSPDACVREAFSLIGSRRMNLEIDRDKQYYVSKIQMYIEKSSLNSSIRDIVIHIKVHQLVVYDNDTALLLVSVPASLIPKLVSNKEATSIMIAALKYALKTDLHNIAIIYSSPNLQLALEKLTIGLQDLVEKHVVISIGCTGGILVVGVLEDRLKEVGGIQNFVDLVASLLPEDSWAVVVVNKKLPTVTLLIGTETLSKPSHSKLVQTVAETSIESHVTATNSTTNIEAAQSSITVERSIEIISNNNANHNPNITTNQAGSGKDIIHSGYVLLLAVPIIAITAIIVLLRH